MLNQPAGKGRLINRLYFGILFFGKTAMEINKNMNDSFKNIKHLLKECHHICFEHQLSENELIYQYFGL